MSESKKPGRGPAKPYPWREVEIGQSFRVRPGLAIETVDTMTRVAKRRYKLRFVAIERPDAHEVVRTA